ncbi:T-lymphocyte surface antigen Ly-9-like isoform X2 [Sardina pilchardus]|uniref:T-lymphocyte surface antigen Ly-9-like isoform X2 n=1 Tax=Sardina pilchardus TaxID=27697 RepID=UPI002E0EF9A3
MFNCVIRQTHLTGAVLGLTLLFGCPAACPMTNLSRPEGTSVILSMGYKPTAAADIIAVEWSYNEDELIMRYYPGIKLLVQPAYEGRVRFHDDTFSLELSNVKRDDSGLYHCEITEKKTTCAGYKLSVMDLTSEERMTSTPSTTAQSTRPLSHTRIALIVAVLCIVSCCVFVGAAAVRLRNHACNQRVALSQV